MNLLISSIVLLAVLYCYFDNEDKEIIKIKDETDALNQKLIKVKIPEGDK